MGFLDSAMKKLQAEAEKAFEDYNKKSGNTVSFAPSSDSSTHTAEASMTMSDILHYGNRATRWEKTVVAADLIVSEVAYFDPDGVEVVCVGGESPDGFLDASDDGPDEQIDWHKGIKDTEGLESTITSRVPGGPCPLGKAMEQILKEAVEKDLAKTPCSILVLTAGEPDDPELLEDALQSAAQVVADNGGVEKCPLSVTFIQIGEDEDGSKYLSYLDKKMVGINADSGDKVDIVDTMGYQELKETMDAMSDHKAKETEKKAQTGAIVGAVAGAAIGLSGMLMYEVTKKKKRVKSGSWGGKWKCYYEDELVTTLDVTDDKAGNLTIEGLQDTMKGTYYHSSTGAAVDSDNFFIRFTEPSGEVVSGTFDSENFVLNWSDGTRWEADDKAGWAKYLGAATAGAAALGVTGYTINKKFFRKVGDQDACDYIIVLDRSVVMGFTDE